MDDIRDIFRNNKLGIVLVLAGVLLLTGIAYLGYWKVIVKPAASQKQADALFKGTAATELAGTVVARAGQGTSTVQALLPVTQPPSTSEKSEVESQQIVSAPKLDLDGSTQQLANVLSVSDKPERTIVPVGVSTPLPTSTSTPSGCLLKKSWGTKLLAWCTVIDKEAARQAKYGVTPELIAAIIFYQGVEEKAIDASGGVGLMGIVSRDWKCYEIPCIPGRPSYKDLLDGSKNIQWGAHFLIFKLYEANRDSHQTFILWYNDVTTGDKVYKIYQDHIK